MLSTTPATSLAPAPEASRVALIRRASYDLTGLPPTPEEVEAFLRDIGLESCVQAVVHNGFYTSMEALRGATPPWPAPRSVGEWEVGLLPPWAPKSMAGAPWRQPPLPNVVARALRLPNAKVPTSTAAVPTALATRVESSLTLLRRLFQVVMIISLAAAPAETMGLALIAFVLAGLRAMFAGDEW